MLLAIAALLIQPRIAPQLTFAAEKIVLSQPDSAQPPAQPVAESASVVLPDAPVPMAIISSPAPVAFLKPAQPMTVSVKELIAENREKRLVWNGLTIATHATATFDAWTTRHAITTAGAQELDPLLKPFAGNSSLYAAIQVGPALMDFAGRKMMYSSHRWVRRMWWIPQSASIASSLLCGTHNLGVH